jgi:hypothetical protein
MILNFNQDEDRQRREVETAKQGKARRRAKKDISLPMLGWALGTAHDPDRLSPLPHPPSRVRSGACTLPFNSSDSLFILLLPSSSSQLRSATVATVISRGQRSNSREIAREEDSKRERERERENRHPNPL